MADERNQNQEDSDGGDDGAKKGPQSDKTPEHDSRSSESGGDQPEPYDDSGSEPDVDDNSDIRNKPAIDNGQDDVNEPDTTSDPDSDDDGKLGSDPDQQSSGEGGNEEPPDHPGKTVLVISWPLYVALILLVLVIAILIVRFLRLEPDDGGVSVIEVTRIVEVAPESEQVDIQPEATRVPYPPEEFFVEDELIVSGPAGAVENATTALIDNGTISEPDRLEVRELPGAAQCPGLSERPNQGQDLVIDRYTILDEGTDVATLINTIQNDQVVAEPNRIIGLPWEIEGSPWEIEGSPWEIEGSLGGSAVTASAEADASPEQWAFGKHGIELPDLPDTPWPTGNEILVGVFDTLPFYAEADQPREIDIDWVKSGWVSDPPSLTLTALSLETDADSLAGGGDLGSGMINHGLFVAGLIHAIAPDSTIQLIRVLDKENVGDLFTLTESLHDFLQTSNLERYEGAVINMSLGIRIPPLEARNLSGLPREINSLRDLIAIARCSNVVVVAAAGNNSARVSVPELPNLPAAWSSVIGVSASNINKGRACFSNLGDIGAPGGDGRETDGPAEICRPRNHECLDAECPFAVIGPISKTLTTSSGFAYWTGSSFAAPMVSGLAAQVLDEANGNLTPAQVQAIIECGAVPSNDRYLGAGVINVRRTIEECIALPAQAAAQ